jgi:hypothetical protein
VVRAGRIRHGRAAAARILPFSAITLAVIATAPVTLVVGEPLRRYCLRRHRLARVISHPVLIAVTAPERWAIDQVRSFRTGDRGFGRRRGNSPPEAGVREPRRPKPSAPAGAIALAEPKQQLRVIPMLKAVPPALSEPVRRVGSVLLRTARMLRLRITPRRA